MAEKEKMQQKRTVWQKVNSIKNLNPEKIVALHNNCGTFWVGQARFVFGALSVEGLNSTEIMVTSNGEVIA